MTDQSASLPYAGTSGWSGSDTSRERAEREDAEGTTAQRQRVIYAEVAAAGAYGVTAAELCASLHLPTNSVAPSLTVLHVEHRIERVKERRGRHEIYVLPEHVNGREVAVAGRGGARLRERAERVEALAHALADRLGEVDPEASALVAYREHFPEETRP